MCVILCKIAVIVVIYIVLQMYIKLGEFHSSWLNHLIQFLVKRFISVAFHL